MVRTAFVVVFMLEVAGGIARADLVGDVTQPLSRYSPAVRQQAARELVRAMSAAERQRLAKALPDTSPGDIAAVRAELARRVREVSSTTGDDAIEKLVARVAQVPHRTRVLFSDEMSAVEPLLRERNESLRRLVAADLIDLRRRDAAQLRALVARPSQVVLDRISTVERTVGEARSRVEGITDALVDDARSRIASARRAAAETLLREGMTVVERVGRHVDRAKEGATLLQSQVVLSAVADVMAEVRSGQQALDAHRSLVANAAQTVFVSRIAEPLRRTTLRAGELRAVAEHVQVLRHLLTSPMEPNAQLALAMRLDPSQRRAGVVPPFVGAQTVADRVQAAADHVASIVTLLRVPPQIGQRIAKGAQLVSSTVRIASQLLGPNPLSALGSVMGLFGGGGSSDPRLDQILGQLDEVLAGQQKIIELQHQILANQQRILEAIAQLSAQLETTHKDIVKRFERMERFVTIIGDTQRLTTQGPLTDCENFLASRSSSPGFSMALKRFVRFEDLGPFLQSTAAATAWNGCHVGLGQLFLASDFNPGVRPLFLLRNELFRDGDDGRRFAEFYDQLYVPTMNVTLALTTPSAFTTRSGRRVAGDVVLRQPILVPALERAVDYLSEILPILIVSRSGGTVVCSNHDLVAGTCRGDEISARTYLRDALLLVRVAKAQQTMLSGQDILAPLAAALVESLTPSTAPRPRAEDSPQCTSSDRVVNALCLIERNGYIRHNVLVLLVRQELASVQRTTAISVAGYRLALADPRPVGLEALLPRLVSALVPPSTEEPCWRIRLGGKEYKLPDPEWVATGALLRPEESTTLDRLEADLAGELALLGEDATDASVRVALRRSLEVAVDECAAIEPRLRSALNCP